MARRRMLSIDVVETDLFLDMPLTTQALYFHLVLNADDDGIVAYPRKIMKVIGAQVDDLRILITKNFVMELDGGLVIIVHWLMQNKIQPTRKVVSAFSDRLESLVIVNNVYQLKDPVSDGFRINADNLPTTCQQNIDNLSEQYSTSKGSTSKGSILSAEAVAPAPVVEQSSTPKKPNSKKPKKKIDEVDISKVADYFGNEKVNMAFNEFLKARKEIKGTKNTPRAVKLLIDELKPFDPEEQYRAITTSIMNSWKGVFPKHITGSGATGTGNEFLDILIQNKGEL